MQSTKPLQLALGHQFVSDTLLTRALTHRSIGDPNNERLEFFGDSILGMVISSKLYERFPRAAEGDLTKMRARLVRGQTLSQVARRLKLSDYVLLGPGELKSGGHNRDSILADALEAILGAIYLDSCEELGLNRVTSVIDTLFEKELSEISTNNIKDPKTSLQEYLQKENLPLPVYKVVRQTGPQHALEFEVICSVSHNDYQSTATGNSRRDAEQAAAAAMLNYLRNE